MQFPILKEPGGVGEFFGEGEVVGGEEDGFAVVVGEAFQERKQLATTDEIEEGSGFVQEKHWGLLGEGFGNHYFLLFAVAQGFKWAVGEGFNADELQGFGDNATVVSTEGAPELGVGRATESDDFLGGDVAQVGALGEVEGDGRLRVES